MAVNPTLLELTDRVLAELPRLARQVIEDTGFALQRSSKNFNLQEAWSRRRSRFAGLFDDQLRPQLQALREGRLAEPSRQRDFDGLALVDEREALHDVAVAHCVEVITETSRQELFQLVNFFAALNRSLPHGRDPNALRPALFGTALVKALAGADLQAEAHFALTRVAAPALAQALKPLYQQLVLVLRDAKLTPLVNTRTTGRERPQARVDTGPGALSDWHARSQQAVSSPQAARPMQGLGASSGSMLDQLYERILADPTLTPAVKAQLGRLQVAVARLSRDDSSLLRRNDHPTWRLINAVAAYASGLAATQDPLLASFLQFLEGQTKTLVEANPLTGRHFEQLLRHVDAFIARQAQERSAPSQGALAAIERGQKRKEWLHLLREQLAQQCDSMRVGRAVRHLLLGPWAHAVVQAMVQSGHESPQAEALIHLVEDLVDSLRPRRDVASREALRQRLPALVASIEQALAPVDLPEAKRKVLLMELMQLHSRVLSGQADEASPEPKAVTPASSVFDEPSEQELSRFVEERNSAFSSVWAHVDVDRTQLPTQPVPLSNAAEEQRQRKVQQWLDQLRIGGWFHLYVAGHWQTAQLVWISAERRFFLFVGQDADQRQSLTEGALAQLYQNGLAMYLEQEGLVERAVATLMQDLEP